MARKIEKVFRTIFYSEIFLTPDIWQKGAYKYKKVTVGSKLCLDLRSFSDQIHV